jgi:hypothetical protein
MLHRVDSFDSISPQDCLLFLKDVCIRAIEFQVKPLYRTKKEGCAKLILELDNDGKGFGPALHLRNIISAVLDYRQTILHKSPLLSGSDDDDDFKAGNGVATIPNLVLKMIFDILQHFSSRDVSSQDILAQCLKDLPPFPSEFKDLSNFYHENCTHLTCELIQSIIMVLSLDCYGSRSYALMVLTYFSKVILSHKDKFNDLCAAADNMLFHSLPSDQEKFYKVDFSEPVDGLTSKVLCSQLVYKLLQLCTHCDESVRVAAALCAGRVGAVHPPLLRLGSSVRENQAAAICLGRGGGSGLPAVLELLKHKNQPLQGVDMTIASHHHRVLEALDSLLASNDGKYSTICINILTTIFRRYHNEASKAFLKLGVMQQLHLYPFFAMKPSSFPEETNFPIRSFSDELWENELQSCHSQSRLQNGICRISQHLVELVRDPILKACQPLVSRHWEFASKAFPWICYDIIFLRRDADSNNLANSVAPKLARQLNRLASLTTQSDITSRDMTNFVIPIVCSTVIFILEKRIEFHKSAEKVRTTWLSTKEKVFWNSAQELISLHFINNLDFLTLALASKQCLSYDGTLMLLEEVTSETYLCKDVNHMLGEASRTTSPSSISLLSTANSAEVYRSLLTEVYRHVQDPDGMYGVPPNSAQNSYLTQLPFAEHEGSWPKTLPLYDSLLRAHETDSTEGAFLSLPRVEGGSLRSSSISNPLKRKAAAISSDSEDLSQSQNSQKLLVRSSRPKFQIDNGKWISRYHSGMLF